MKALLRLIATITIIIGQTGTVAAITNTDLNHVINDTPFYDPTDGLCDTDTGGGSGGPANDNAVAAYQFFVGKGLAPFRAAAIIGNLMQESHVNPKADNPAASGGGGGIAQWEGGRWSGPSGLNAFADGTGNFASNGKQGAWNDLTVQLNFMWWEATHTHSDALTALKAATTIDSATEQWESKYEGAGIPRMDNRIRYAKEALADPRMGNGAPSTGPPDASGTPRNGTNVGTGSGCSSNNVPPEAMCKVGPSGETLNAVDCAAYWANRVIHNPNIVLLNPGDTLPDLQKAAAKQTINNSDTCNKTIYLHYALLYALDQTASVGGFKIGIYNIVSGHGCDQFLHPKGRASDIGSVNGASTDTSVSGRNNRSFAEYIAKLLPHGGDVLQANKCFPATLPPWIGDKADTCNHIHIDVGSQIK